MLDDISKRFLTSFACVIQYDRQGPNAWDRMQTIDLIVCLVTKRVLIELTVSFKTDQAFSSLVVKITKF